MGGVTMAVWLVGVLGHGLLVAAVLSPLWLTWLRERRRRAAAARRGPVLPDDLPVDYTIAVLAGGDGRTWDVAVTRLHSRGAVTLAEGKTWVEITPAPGAEAEDDFESRVLGAPRDTGTEDRILNALVDADLLRRRDGYEQFRWAPFALVGAMLVTAGLAALLIATTPHAVSAFGILLVLVLTVGGPQALTNATDKVHSAHRYATTARGREHALTLAEGREGPAVAVALNGVIDGHPDREVGALFRPPPPLASPSRGEPDNFGGIGVGV